MTKAVVVQHPLHALTVNGDNSSTGTGRGGHDNRDGIAKKQATTTTTATAATSISATNDSTTTQLASEEESTEYRNNADKILGIRVDTSSSVAVRDEQIRRVIEVLCPFLLADDSYDDCQDDDDSEVSSEGDLQIKPLTGGLSNHLFIVNSNNGRAGRGCRRRTTAPTSVLVRVHPETSPDGGNVEIVHREWENRFAAWLAAQNDGSAATAAAATAADQTHSMAPTVYGRFENGRVEEFYENVRPLTWGEMKDYAPQIASSMADFHRLDAPPHVLPKPSGNHHGRGTIYETAESWLEAAAQLVQTAPPVEDGTNDDAFTLLKELQQQWAWLKQQLFDGTSPSSRKNPTLEEQALAFIRRVAVTHMDCQPLNILVEDTTADKDMNSNDSGGGSSSRKSETVRLIDFEYSGWNPIAADIANTFCEYCEMSNLRANYDVEYPSPSHQDLFFRHYIQRSDPALAESLTANVGSNDWEIFSKALQREVGRFSLLSHLSWAVWSVIKSFEEDGVDFDYMVYAAHRMDGYAWAKAKFCDAL